MSSQPEACRASALRCLEVTDETCSPEDAREFISFAESWHRLANEIECAERLIALIDELAGSNPTQKDVGRELDQITHRYSAHSLRRLSTAIASISSHFIAEHFASRADAGRSGSTRAE
jgi:hypothetical protein